MENKMVVYVGPGYRIKKGLCPPQFSAHGLVFKTGVIYKVTDEVFEYLKGIRGFHEVKGMDKEVVSWKSGKNEVTIKKEVDKTGYKPP